MEKGEGGALCNTNLGREDQTTLGRSSEIKASDTVNDVRVNQLPELKLNQSVALCRREALLDIEAD